MVKYNRVSAPLRKAKESAMLIEDIERSNVRKLEQAYQQKRRNDAWDKELYDFGTDLYNAGYNLEDFVSSIKECINSGFMTAEQIEATGWFLYDIEHVPSFQKLAKVVGDSNYIQTIQNGYNLAYRRALINKHESENGRGR